MSMHEQDDEQVEAQLAQLGLHDDEHIDDNGEEEVEDEETRRKKYRWLDKYRTTPMLRRCFDFIFIHFSLLDWIRMHISVQVDERGEDEDNRIASSSLSTR